jgi:hypothetical protein
VLVCLRSKGKFESFQSLGLPEIELSFPCSQSFLFLCEIMNVILEVKIQESLVQIDSLVYPCIGVTSTFSSSISLSRRSSQTHKPSNSRVCEW